MLSSLSGAHGLVRSSFGIGYRVDQQKYTISLPDVRPRSELKWSGVQCIEALGEVDWILGRYHAGLEGAVGQIFSGRFIDSDWLISGRQFLFSKTNSKVEGNTYDLDLKLGFDLFYGREGQVIVRPLMGASYHNMFYKNFDLAQEVGSLIGLDQFGNRARILVHLDPPLPTFDGVISSHRSEWLTGWVGFDLLWRGWDELMLRASLRGHSGMYQSTGDWRLRPDLAPGVSFKNKALANGIEARFGGAWRLLHQTSVSLDLRYRYFSTGNGGHFAFTTGNGTVTLPFDQAIWSSFQIVVGLLRSF
jgi:Protochlamydia outer membrane protein